MLCFLKFLFIPTVCCFFGGAFFVSWFLCHPDITVMVGWAFKSIALSLLVSVGILLGMCLLVCVVGALLSVVETFVTCYLSFTAT